MTNVELRILIFIILIKYNKYIICEKKIKKLNIISKKKNK